MPSSTPEFTRFHFGASRGIRGAGESATNDEGQRDRLFDVDAHERGGLGVLGDGANPSTEFRRTHQSVGHDQGREAATT